MRKLAALAFVLATHAGVAFGATVDAGEVTTVEVDAPLYDTRLSVDGGCDPSGCIASMTRVRGGEGLVRPISLEFPTILPYGNEISTRVRTSFFKRFYPRAKIQLLGTTNHWICLDYRRNKLHFFLIYIYYVMVISLAQLMAVHFGDNQISTRRLLCPRYNIIHIIPNVLYNIIIF